MTKELNAFETQLVVDALDAYTDLLHDKLSGEWGDDYEYSDFEDMRANIGEAERLQKRLTALPNPIERWFAEENDRIEANLPGDGEPVLFTFDVKGRRVLAINAMDGRGFEIRRPVGDNLTFFERRPIGYVGPVLDDGVQTWRAMDADGVDVLRGLPRSDAAIAFLLGLSDR